MPVEPQKGLPLNESPSEKEGKYLQRKRFRRIVGAPSMKVPPKRKGNAQPEPRKEKPVSALNESPSEKEGK